MPAAIAMVWKWIYNSDYGLLNYILSWFGIDGPNWLTNPNIALYSIIIVAIWGGIGYNMVIFLSGSKTSLKHTMKQQLWMEPGQLQFKITLPLLSPVIFL